MPELPLPSSQLPVLHEWLRDLRDFLASVTSDPIDRRRRRRLADTTDEGMMETLASAILRPPASRWDRAAVRATIGLHAIRMRRAGVSGEQGLARFKELLHRATPLDSVRADAQIRVRREMIRWWVEAYYEPDV
jgi:hypothetical protein